MCWSFQMQVGVMFFFVSTPCLHLNSASPHHTFSWIRKFDAGFESFYTSLALLLRSFHHIRSSLSVQSGQDVASTQLFCSHLCSTLGGLKPLYWISCAWKKCKIANLVALFMAIWTSKFVKVCELNEACIGSPTCSPRLGHFYYIHRVSACLKAFNSVS